jgi:hypothetical protein
MAKAIADNRTMSSLFSSLQQFVDKRKRIVLRLLGPKDVGGNTTLFDEPPQPKSEDLFYFNL